MAKAKPTETVPAPAPVAPPVVEAPAPAPAPAPVVSKSKAVAKVAPTTSAVAVWDNPAALTGFGLQEARVEDYALPFLVMIQSNSPELSKYGKEKGIVAGDLWNTATHEPWDGAAGAEIVPCYYAPRLIEWVPKSAGGGFVASHRPDSPKAAQAVRKGSKDILPNGNELQQTAQWVCLIKGDQGWQPVMLSLKSTQFKKSKRLLSLIRGQRVPDPNTGEMVEPAPLYFIYTVKAEDESNDKGNWKGFAFTCTGRQTSEVDGLRRQAYALASDFAKGDIKASAPPADAPAGEPGSKAGFTAEQSEIADDTI